MKATVLCPSDAQAKSGNGMEINKTRIKPEE
jgi:hypothetical protein